MNERPPSDDSGATLRVLRFAALLTGLMAVPAFSGFALGTLAPLLMEDVGLTRAQLGSLVTALYIGAAVVSPAMGRASDTWTTRTSFAVVFTIAAATLLGLSMAPSYWWLLLFSIGAGTGQAGANPLGNKLVAEHVQESRRGLIMGAKQSGAPLSAIAAGSFLPFLAVAIGWRGALIASTGLVLIVYLAIVREVPAKRPLGAPRREHSRARGASGGVLFLSIYAFLMGSGIAVVTTYLPLYAYESLGLTVSVAGTLIGVIGVIGVIARITIGHVLDRTSVASAQVLGVLALTATAAIAFLLAAEVLGVLLAWIGAVLFGASIAWNTVAMMATIQVAHPGRVGRASGTVMVGFFCGFVIAPVAFGASVDALGGYRVPWVVLATALLCTALTTAISHRKGRIRGR